MQYLVQRHHVGLTGPLKAQGTKRTGRQIAHVVEFEDHRESRARHLGWIKTAAEGKAGLGRYGKSYELLIVVEDWWFNNDDDATEVVTFIDREVLTLPLEFGTVHLVGLTERLFMHEPQKLKEFRELVLSKMSRFWEDAKDIKIAIAEKEGAHESDAQPEPICFVVA
jgi:hypothetical protein